MKVIYTTYILYSKTLKKFYTGQTEDLDRRFDEHNRGKTAFLRKGIPWVIVYKKNFEKRAESIWLERKIKKRGARRFLADQGIVIG